MINNDRIVPIQKCDFLTMIGIILTLQDVTYHPLLSLSAEGDFVVPANGIMLANQPVKTMDIRNSVTEATVYFVADPHFEGISINGTKAELETEIKADGITLYSAVIASGAVTVSAISPIEDEE